MNRKQLLILLVVAAVVGGAGVMVYKNRNASRQAGNSGIGQKLLADLPVNDVAHLAIRHGSNEVNLVRKDDQWRVRERADYPANFSRISGFLLKARDLKITQSDSVGPSQLARLELAPGQGSNSPVIVEFKGQNDKPIRTLLLGKKHMKKSAGPSPMGEGNDSWPDGRYVKVDAGSENVALISEPLDDVEPAPEQWINKDFFRVEKARSVAVMFPVATNSWKLARETEAGEWKLADAKGDEQLDSSKTSGFSGLFSSPTFSDVRPGVTLEAEGTNQPVRVTVETFDDFAYTINLGQNTDDDHLLTVAVVGRIPDERAPGKDEKPEDKVRLDKEFADRRQKLTDKLKQEQSYGRWTYVVSGWVVDPVLKERAQLLAGKPETPADMGGRPEAPKKTESPTPPPLAD